jgi:hypothetical protein
VVAVVQGYQILGPLGYQATELGWLEHFGLIAIA